MADAVVYLLWEQPKHIKANAVLSDTHPPRLKGVFANEEVPLKNAMAFNDQFQYRTRWVTDVVVES